MRTKEREEGERKRRGRGGREGGGTFRLKTSAKRSSVLGSALESLHREHHWHACPGRFNLSD